MRKVDRLFEIIQLLRGHRLRTAEFIAAELGVSQRTIYRDIAGLMASGVPIEGERGVGYLITQPIEMPPMHFTPLELKALQMGTDLVKAVADREIAAAAQEAAYKIADAMPANRKTSLIKAPTNIMVESDDDTKETLGVLRNSIDQCRKVQISYCAKSGQSSIRVIRALALEYWGMVWTCSAWCELRHDFRAFRVDLIENYSMLDDVYSAEKGKTYQDFVKQIMSQDS